MSKFRKGPRIDFIDAQIKFMVENGIKANGADVLDKIMVLLFEEDSSGRLACRTSNMKISLDWNSTEDIKEGELWICLVTMNTNNLGYARPLKRVESSDIVGMKCGMEDIADFIWKNNRDEVAEHLGRKIDSEIRAGMEEKISELEEEHSRKIAEIERKEAALQARESELVRETDTRIAESRDATIKDYELKVAHLNELSDELRTKAERLTKEKSTIMNYYESRNACLEDEIESLRKSVSGPRTEAVRNTARDEKEREIAELKMEISKLRAVLADREEEAAVMKRKMAMAEGDIRDRMVERALYPISNSVLRISESEFRCSFMDDGRYSVKVNADMTVMRFVPDERGCAICRDGLMSVPELRKVDAFGNRTGELKWRVVNDKVLEVSIRGDGICSTEDVR